MRFIIQDRGENGRQHAKAPIAAAITAFVFSPHPPNQPQRRGYKQLNLCQWTQIA